MADADDMVNYWGCNYATITRSGSATMHDLDLAVRRTVPGFTLRTLTPNGTTANQFVIEKVTMGERSRCLIALGSYVGGDGSANQNLSTSGFNEHKDLCIPIRPSEATQQALDQTVPFPYFVPSTKNKKNEMVEMESQCLEAIQLRIVHARMMGKPFLGLLMETMLGGCGGELSASFLEKLGKILKHNNISVIVDEVLTGGRRGPGFSSALSLPKEFFEQIKFITFGKIFQCGIVVEKVTVRPSQHDSEKRGHSTELCPGEAFAYWKKIVELVDAGMLEERREAVLKKFGVSNEADEGAWGAGLLIFTKFKRTSLGAGIKCRLLPRIDFKKMEKRGLVESATNSRRCVNLQLMDSVSEWIDLVKNTHHTAINFRFQIAKAIYSDPKQSWNADSLISFVGERLAEKMAKAAREEIVNLGYCQTCTKSAKTAFNDALSAIVKLRNDKILKATRKYHKRVLCYVIADKDPFFRFDSDNDNKENKNGETFLV